MPVAGLAREAASPRAVAIPIRRPVKEPGPSPTAIRSTASQPPAAAAAASTSVRSAVACRGLPASESPSWETCSSSPSRQAQAAVSALAVSKPTTTSGTRPRQPLTRKLVLPTFLPLTNQLTVCLPGTVEVMRLT